MRYTLFLALSGLLVAGCNDVSQPLAPHDEEPVFAAGKAVTHRQLEDFLATSRNCPMSWTDPSQPNINAIIDFWDFFASRARRGILPEALAATTYTGSVMERPLADGTAEITVRVHARDAFTSARIFTDQGPGPALFGYLSGEVAAGSPPVLGHGTFSITYINTAPAAPLPDFCDVIFEEGNPWQVSQIQVTGSASGPIRATLGMPEGTPGRLNIVQTGRFLPQAQGNGVADGWPAERISIKPVGR